MSTRRILLISAPVLVAAVSLFFYLSGERFVDTDNAYVKADKVMIAPEISAAVSEVLVAENAAVSKGQPLFKLDAGLFVVALDRARARQDKVRTDIEALQAAYRSKQAELTLAQTNAAFAEKEYRRQADLSQQHFASQIQLDSLHHSLDVARQQLAVLQQDIERVLAGLNHEPDAAVEKYPAYQEVAAELAQASINLDHATVYAPFDGVVSNVPKLGQHLNAGSPALTLVASRAPWIEANFNETDLTHVLPGQTAEIRVDMYPDLRLSGKVASISPASGAEFSILPAQNASGNWVKVVQRITVRIELDNQDTTPGLRPGMSTQINIDTGSNRFQRIGQ